MSWLPPISALLRDEEALAEILARDGPPTGTPPVKRPDLAAAVQGEAVGQLSSTLPPRAHTPNQAQLDLFSVLSRGSKADHDTLLYWRRRRSEEGDPLSHGVLLQIAAAAEQKRKRFLSVQELEALRSPQWLVGGWLPEESLGVLFGPASIGKTYVALAASLSVACGVPWLGIQVRQGPVVYSAGEGTGGLAARTRAWREAHGVGSVEGLQILPEPVNLLNLGDVDAFIEAIAPYEPVFVILDTLARCLVGGEENSAKDMGLAVHHAARIQHGCGAAVLLIHHSGKQDKSEERGSSALSGAVDVRLKLSGKGTLRLECLKQKDAAAPAPIGIRLVEHGESLVPERSDLAWDAGDDQTLAALRVLVEVFGKDGAAASQWAQAFEEEVAQSKATFWRAKKALIEDGLIESDSPPGKRGARFAPTRAGAERVALNSIRTLSETPESEPTSSLSRSHPSLEGEGVRARAIEIPDGHSRRLPKEHNSRRHQ